MRAFAAAACLLVAAPGFAQGPAPLPGPSVGVTGAATTRVQNDRMQATLRVEAEHADAAQAGREVNARMAKALDIARGVKGVEARSVGYNTWQTWDKGKPSKWRVTQSLQLTGADFPALAALVTRLQDELGMLVNTIAFSVLPDTRRTAEERLMREAILAWQQRATIAADALGYSAWRPGRLDVSSGDMPVSPRPEIMMRAAAPQAAGAPPPPVSVEAGATEITVTVSGDAVLDGAKR